jgi:hypothetical protein
MTRVGLVVLLALGCGDDDGGSDDTPPSIVSRTPDAAAQNVYVSDPIVVVFDEAIEGTPTIALTRADGTAIAHGATWSTDRMTLTLAINERPPAPQMLTLALSGVADAAGNVMADATWSWDLPMWQQPGEMVSGSASAGGQRVTRDSMGRLLITWQEGQQVFAKRLSGSTWEALGAGLGIAGQASFPAIAVDGMDRPVVAWMGTAEGTSGAIQVARWDGSGWQALASPGNGYGVAVAAAADGTIYVATQGSSDVVGSSEMNVYRLGSGDAWDGLGGPFSLSGFGSPDVPPGVALAVAGTTPVVAWVSERGGTKELRTARKTGAAWETLPILNVIPTSNARYPQLVAEPSGRVAIAYEEYTDSTIDARVAALTDGGAWEPIGRQLDVDLLADARWPGLAADAGGLWASWVEFKGPVRRIWVAREAAGGWELVGGQTLNREARSFAGEPRLVLVDGWPAVAWQEWQGNDWMQSHVWLRRYNGNDVRLPGLARRESTAGCTFDPVTTPLLSQTGCFSSLGPEPVAMAGMVHFEINSQLWSDGALKRRWIVLPDGGTITRTDAIGWDVPVGTMMVKEFSLVMDENDPSSRRPVETRFLVKDDAEGNWSGYSLQWDDAFTDAMLLEGSNAELKDWMITTTEGGTRVHSHTYPSRPQCTTCHNGASGTLLGVRTKQLLRRVDYDGIADDQLEAMDRIGLFATPLAGLPSDPIVSPSDPTYPLELRARGYLSANCSHCHPPLRATRDMRWETPLASTMLCADSEIVAGDSASSFLWLRMNARPGMPPIATQIQDFYGMSVISRWIDGMTSCP